MTPKRLLTRHRRLSSSTTRSSLRPRNGAAILAVPRLNLLCSGGRAAGSAQSQTPGALPILRPFDEFPLSLGILRARPTDLAEVAQPEKPRQHPALARLSATSSAASVADTAKEIPKDRGFLYSEATCRQYPAKRTSRRTDRC